MLRQVILPWASITLLAAVLGLGANALRERDRVEIGRVYFTAPAPPPANGTGPAAANGEPFDAALAARIVERAAAEFTVVDTERARVLFDVAQSEPDRVVFVDARDDGHFRAGHVPDALQLDYYNLKADIETPLPALQHVPWLVVYCESADCEDGLLLCRALRDDYGIPADRLMLYAGGMRTWRKHGLPQARGGENR